MVEQVHHQLFLPRAVTEAIEPRAAKPGATNSAIRIDAVTAWLKQRAVDGAEDGR